MKRRIIKIDEEKCNGCGLCAKACHEGAIDMVNGKATLMREDYCDGLGDCLPACPMNAISFEEREALAYDEAAVLAAKKSKEEAVKETAPCSCPGKAARAIQRSEEANNNYVTSTVPSRLNNWPTQIKLAPIISDYYDGANLLVAADCTAYAYGNFHNEFMRNRVTLIGCAMLDATDYIPKLTNIIAGNNIKSVTIARMQVPCCGGIEHAVKEALKASGKFIPWQVVTISVDGNIVE